MRWNDWIDYWSVDFDFENKKEIVMKKEKRNGLVIIYLKMNGSHLNQIIQILNLRLDQEKS